MLILTGGGPSNEAYFMQFKSQENLHLIANLKMIEKRCWHSCVYIENAIYVIGGFNGKITLKKCEKFIIEKDI